MYRIKLAMPCSVHHAADARYCIMMPSVSCRCRNSLGHVDISTNHLQSQGLLNPSWNGSKISWDFLSATPSGYNELPFRCCHIWSICITTQL